MNRNTGQSKRSTQHKRERQRSKYKLRKITSGKIYIDEDMTKKEKKKAKVAKEESDKENKIQ